MVGDFFNPLPFYVDSSCYTLEELASGRKRQSQREKWRVLPMYGYATPFSRRCLCCSCPEAKSLYYQKKTVST